MSLVGSLRAEAELRVWGGYGGWSFQERRAAQRGLQTAAGTPESSPVHGWEEKNHLKGSDRSSHQLENRAHSQQPD